MSNTVLKHQDYQVTISNGELVSYTYHNTELMHQKGDAGWGYTEIEMFPIIGSVSEANYTVQTPKGDTKQDQHGMLRTLAYSLIEASRSTATFKKSYKANTAIPNPKFPNRSTEKELHWTYDFEFIKTFNLSDKGLQITFTINAEEGMPYMLGFHPSFKIYSDVPVLKTPNKEVSLSDVLKAGASAFLLENTSDIVLGNNGKYKIVLNTKGFKDLMLWTEVKNMVCIEPITFYPVQVTPDQLHTGFDAVDGNDVYEVLIRPF